jgi:hypothetical protein
MVGLGLLPRTRAVLEALQIPETLTTQQAPGWKSQLVQPGGRCYEAVRGGRGLPGMPGYLTQASGWRHRLPRTQSSP